MRAAACLVAVAPAHPTSSADSDGLTVGTPAAPRQTGARRRVLILAACEALRDSRALVVLAVASFVALTLFGVPFPVVVTLA